MWRIMGLLFYGNKEHFVDTDKKAFRREEIEAFLTERGIALYDTATAVHRLNDNASDKFLEVVEPTDVAALLRQLPECRAVAVTGQKACDTLCELFHLAEPKVGSFTPFTFEERTLRLYRMPSSSRAYPLKLEQKAAAYGKMLSEL